MPKDKLEVIKTRFEKAEKIVRKEEELKKLKDNSSLKKLCLAIKQYQQGDPYGACIQVYDLFHVRTWRPKDTVYTSYIKSKLKVLKSPASAQIKLFATA